MFLAIIWLSLFGSPEASSGRVEPCVVYPVNPLIEPILGAKNRRLWYDLLTPFRDLLQGKMTPIQYEIATKNLS